ncbi:hypothetical protein HHL24_27165 [Paraburkholderia sp. RP-4-7]|jgi:hypothetical protein|uniref:HEPN AbiU2-like domain-containing protein n=1 Tax=Paraburkholderia polaris TaxID=2728848 RepID=A0A848IL62_9BURK|nr:hypothetical protein [Paraburkholderia polaris]NMM01606.1 hypothetical protein [Paraburkholderia polaris]
MGEAKRRGTAAQRVLRAIKQRDDDDAASTVVSKLEVATRQLDAAIRLFLERDYVSSLTLAGAAEEILGKLSSRAGLDNAVDFVVDFYKGQTDTATDEEHRNMILRILNTPRNQAKHANDASETTYEVDRLNPASMIMRAAPMVVPLGGTMSKEMMRFRNWLRQHPDL